MMEELRKQILLYLEKHSRVDLGELAVLLGTDEVTVANEISAMERAKDYLWVSYTDRLG